ncbi:MAG: hypothetical protein GXP30_13395 [Verrucomicrobia bacterium]|nr:hypothetical protein [Verrucomicrobiota bacterium]
MSNSLVNSCKQRVLRYGIIIPVCNEAECLGEVLDEMREILPQMHFVMAVGLNSTSDRSGDIAVSRGALVGETPDRGYGYGCMAAITALQEAGEEVDGYIFCAGDGASRPEDVLVLVQRFEATGVPLVIGLRQFALRTWWQEFGRATPNLILGVVGFFLTGRFHHDLGPLRLIEKGFFQAIDLREMTWGWTIEAEVRASRMGVIAQTVAVEERPRLKGEQKVSGVSLVQSLKIGVHILLAGVRARFD